MNILFHCWAYPPNGGGVGVYISHMARALSRGGHRVVVATGRAPGEPAEEQFENISVFRFYEYSEIGRTHVTDAVLRLCERYAVDLVEGADFLGDCEPLIRREDRPPVLIKTHSCNVLRVLNESQILFWWQRIMVKAALYRNRHMTERERYSIENADMLLASSQRILLEMKKQGLRLPEKHSVLPNPIEPNRLSHDQEAASPTVLFVGRKDFGKGIQYLPGIVDSLSKKNPDFQMEIVGPDSYARGVGSMRAWLEKRLGDLKRYVRFHERLPNEELDKVYQRAWVVILPSRWDTFPTVLLEAMSWGKPVVASPHGGMPEILEGTMCPTALPQSPEFVSWVKRFLEDGNLRKSAGASMLDKVSREYHPRSVVKSYLEFIQSTKRRR